jgi:hypothetical protein
MPMQLSGVALVPHSEDVAASYLKTQDYFLNAPTTDGFAPVKLSVNMQALSGVSNFNIANGFLSGNARTVTAANSGPFAPAGFFAVQVSGSVVQVPFFAP